MLGSRKISLTFSVNWLLAVFILALALLGTFILAPTTWRPFLIFGAAVVGGAAALTTAINAVDARAAQGKQAKLTAAMEFIRCWNTPELYHAKKNGREIIQYFKDHPRIEDQVAFLEEDTQRKANLLDLLNIFEALGLAVEKEVVDEDMVRRFFRSIVLQYWHSTEPLTKNRRAERGNARLMREFESLAKRWGTD